MRRLVHTLTVRVLFVNVQTFFALLPARLLLRAVLPDVDLRVAAAGGDLRLAVRALPDLQAPAPPGASWAVGGGSAAYGAQRPAAWEEIRIATM